MDKLIIKLGIFFHHILCAHLMRTHIYKLYFKLQFDTNLHECVV